MGCREDSVDSEALYWSSRGINPQTHRYTCCGVVAFDERESNKPHLWSCRRIAQIRVPGRLRQPDGGRFIGKGGTVNGTWSYRSSATCWVVTGRSVTIDFPSEKLAREYVDFKNQQPAKA